MAGIDQEPNELEKLLADVRRTIRDNELFICSLKNEAVDAAAGKSDDEHGDDDVTAAAEDFEEL